MIAASREHILDYTDVAKVSKALGGNKLAAQFLTRKSLTFDKHSFESALRETNGERRTGGTCSYDRYLLFSIRDHQIFDFRFAICDLMSQNSISHDCDRDCLTIANRKSQFENVTEYNPARDSHSVLRR
jgi:hypothetical protein